MTEQEIQSLIRVGDTLIYRPKGFFGHLIALKTWDRTASHCEIYLGDGESVASRDGQGVAIYPWRLTELSWILRLTPEAKQEFSLFKAFSWLHRPNESGIAPLGQKYDWKGILVFTLAAKQGAPDRMFCSEFWTRFMRGGGLEPFSQHIDKRFVIDADHVAPTTILFSSKVNVVASPSDLAGTLDDYKTRIGHGLLAA